MAVKTEVIDLADESTTCDALEDYPIDVYETFGGLINDRLPLICGGRNVSSFFSECYIAGSTNRDPVVKLLTPRTASTAVVLNSHQLWITGGQDESKILKTTEIVDALTSFAPVVKGPELPLAMNGHCAVKLNENTIMFMYMKKSFFFEVSTQTWTNGPDMKHDRVYSGCGMMQMDTGSSMVVVTGGIMNETHSLAATEILKLGDANGLKWSPGKN